MIRYLYFLRHMFAYKAGQIRRLRFYQAQWKAFKPGRQDKYIHRLIPLDRIPKEKIAIMKNAIDADKFLFDQLFREQHRKSKWNLLLSINCQWFIIYCVTPPFVLAMEKCKTRIFLFSITSIPTRSGSVYKSEFCL